MATTKVVVVGDAMLDVYLVGEVDRVSPEAPVPVVAVHASRHGLGGAANVAANVAALGAECRLVAVVGQDTRGTSVRTELDDLHLSISYLVTDPGRPTTSKTRVVARGQQMLRIDEEIDNPISARVMEQLGAALERAMSAALDLAHPDALPAALTTLAVDNLLLTLGGEGMMLVTKDQEITRIPTMAREVFDVSGAGDTVTAWVGTALAAGASVREAAHIANFAAGIEVGKAGVATVSGPEVLAVHEAYYDQLGKLRREGLL